MKAALKKRLGDILMEMDIISNNDLERASKKVEQGKNRLGDVLIKEGIITEDALAQALAKQYEIKYYPLDTFHIPHNFLKSISVELMHRYPFIPYAENDGILTIIVSDPSNIMAIDELELILGRGIEIGVSYKTAILDVLKRSESSGQALKRIESDFKPELIKETEDGEDVISLEKLSRDTSPVIKLVDSVLLNALQKRASDIHIEPSEKNVSVKYRVDGVLYPAMEPLDIKFHAPLISRIKVMSELDITEKRIPQDGRFKIRLENKKIDFRVSILPSIFGEASVIRILDKEYITQEIDELRLERLGFNDNDLKKFRKAVAEPYGMVLVTGPTGSGKTTTLYAAITEINNNEDKIITIEDPVEYQLKGIVQIPVNEKKGLTFAKGLRSILRHDPDKIMVGEIRDTETAQIAIQSALTGHLVFTTVHANNVFDVIGRFVNMGIEPYNFVSALNCILAQRLVRTLCPLCKEPVKLTKAMAEESGIDIKAHKNPSVYQNKGCPECNGTGFKGRKCITEFLHLSDKIKEMILEKRLSYEIKKQAIAEGMTTLREAAMEKVFKGETTLKEINRVTFIE
ncbi:MAG: ATPase, T2SS/T4P/T4SS family [Nitrospirota bacterium]